uniref:Uncharacterized protein n=1 Tax=Cacopsylla melanoneura TaxID=428564 RepID=A0A8D9F6A3_9HEMI
MFNSFLSFSIQIHIMYTYLSSLIFDLHSNGVLLVTLHILLLSNLFAVSVLMFPGIFKTLCICILSIDALMLVEYTIPTYLTTSTFLLERRRYIKYLIVNFIFIIYLIFIRLVPLK